MKTATNIPKNRTLHDIERSFAVSLNDMRRITRDFRLEMEKGLAGRKSSLKMIPAYVDKPTGHEKGRFIALDFGGTNFRILELDLKGDGKISSSVAKSYVLGKRLLTGSAQVFFGFIADCINDFLEEKRLAGEDSLSLGFTFSFPVRQTGIASGVLIRWTKGFRVKGVIGNDVVGMLRDALAKKGISNVAVAALANDTVGTLMARSYADPDCDIGAIIGTGTNACYREEISKIKRWRRPFRTGPGKMIVNTEWGNFNKLHFTAYDKTLDRATHNRGEQLLEKMVSGMYLGEVTRLVLVDLIKKKELFGGAFLRPIRQRGSFKTEHISLIESDKSKGLKETGRLLKKMGVSRSALSDRILLKDICEIVSKRGARVCAAAFAAIIVKMDKRLSAGHTVAVDGTLYEKHPSFSGNIRAALAEIFGKKASKIRMALAKDGSGAGSAIIAAVAARHFY